MMYGTLNEGLQVTPDVSPQQLQVLRIQFVIRRALANLSRFPEGYEVRFRDPQEERQFIVLTPPDLVAVQRQDGTWFRRVRNVSDDGPPPYTQEWYGEYLRANGLPLYFLRPEHVQMLGNYTEAQRLNIASTLPTLPQPDPTTMTRRYSRSIQYLLPDADIASQETPVVLSQSQLHRLALRFPGATVNATMFNSYRVYVLPSGHIFIRYHGGPAAALLPNPVSHEQLRTVDETASTYLASYHIQGRRIGLTAGSTRNRTQERSDAENHGGLVDMNEQPNGWGTWQWLNRDVDPDIALQFNLNTPEEVMRARQNGVLTNVAYNHVPLTVWRPEMRYINPVVQPQGQGRWEYTTTPSQTLAWMNHGGQDDFPDEPYPTAAQIWDLRRRQRDEIARGVRDEETTGDIDLVWVPSAPIQPPNTNNTGSNSATSGSSTPGVDADITDPKSGLRHQPKNRGENDQTGVEGERRYQTIIIHGKPYTVDRSRAHANNIQEWKSWAVSKRGVWYRWKGYSTIDWTTQDPKAPGSVEKLNKWREQALGRAGFPVKREETREPYTEEQLDWLFDYVKTASGERPSNITMDELARRFNTRFPGANRNTLGIQSVYDRLRKEWHKYGGQRKPRTTRTRRKSSQPTMPTEPESEDSDMDDTGLMYDYDYDDDDEEEGKFDESEFQ